MVMRFSFGLRWLAAGALLALVSACATDTQSVANDEPEITTDLLRRRSVVISGSSFATLWVSVAQADTSASSAPAASQRSPKEKRMTMDRATCMPM